MEDNNKSKKIDHGREGFSLSVFCLSFFSLFLIQMQPLAFCHQSCLGVKFYLSGNDRAFI